MNMAALIYADLECDFFGAPSRLGEDLCGRPVLAHTLARLARVAGIDTIILAAPPEQLGRVEKLAQLHKLPRRVVQVPHRRPASPLWASMRAARAFARYGWRGGLAGTCLFDELFDMTLAQAAAERVSADAVFLAPAGSALLDVEWASQVIATHRANDDRYHVAFNQAPPGLSGAAFSMRILRDLAAKSLYPGRLFGYDPARSGSSDPIAQPCNARLPLEVVTTHRRFTADNLRGLWLCRKVMESAGADADGAAACRVAREVGPEPWPREVTIELTTRRPIADALRGWSERGDLPMDSLMHAVEGLQEPRDVNIMLAGGGDAMLHSQWAEAAQRLSQIGHVALATYGVNLSQQAETLARSGVEVVEVYVDAASDAAYAAHKRGDLTAGQVWAEIEAFGPARNAAGAAAPLVVPRMLKNKENLDEQEAFYYRAQKVAGACAISEPSRLAGQWRDLGVAHMAPPVRTPCRRLGNRVTLLADGRAVACEEDLFATVPLSETNLLQAWRGGEMARRRQLHELRQWGELSLCAACEEYHRP